MHEFFGLLCKRNDDDDEDDDDDDDDDDYDYDGSMSVSTKEVLKLYQALLDCA
jgi:hypothetical protein